MKITYATDGKSGYGGLIYAGERKPMLRIANRFLLKSGFKVGTAVEVEYGSGIIIIKIQ